MSQNFRFDFKKSVRTLLLIALVGNLSCSGNVLQDGANKNTDQALLEDAIKNINSGNYDTAIKYLDKITSAFRQDPRVVRVITASYAGKCGLDFFALVTAISAASAATPSMLFMNVFQNVTVVPTSCQDAQNALEFRYGTISANRPTDINLFLAILGMAKMGTNLRAVADTNQDGAVDPAFTSACNPPNLITDPQTIQFGTGLGLVLDNITALTAAVAGNGAIAALNALQLACGAACIITDPNSAAWGMAANVKAIRSVIASNTFGILNCNNPVFLTCCP